MLIAMQNNPFLYKIVPKMNFEIPHLLWKQVKSGKKAWIVIR